MKTMNSNPSDLPPGFTRHAAPKEAVVEPANRRIRIRQSETAFDRGLVRVCSGIGVGVLAFACLLFCGHLAGKSDIMWDLILGSSTVTHSRAYRAAQEFVRSEYVGIEAFDAKDSATIFNTDRQWTVTLSGRGKNAFGGPVRNGFRVEMRDTGDGLNLERLERVDPPVLTTYR